MRVKHYLVTNYWMEFYVSDNHHCSLCGNHGWIDTRGIRTPAGVKCGKINYCICPNGQIMRKLRITIPTVQ